MKGLSIIIATYDVSDYLDQCIESILKQYVDFEYEIIIGIDGCNNTLNHIKNSELYKSLKVFYFDKNSGPFMVKNNLINESIYDNILFFDSDDIMSDGILKKIYDMSDESNMILLNFKDFTNDDVNNTKLGIKTAHGVFYIKKDIFISMNGFENWRCGADTEFIKRYYWNNFQYTKLKDVCFLRRIHDNNLTVKSETRFGSIIRKESVRCINERTKDKNWPNPELIKLSYFRVF
jgi:glycosyltransferase involved in cell wall biosynthesis